MLTGEVNPQLASVDVHKLAVLLGEHRATSIRRGVLRANHRDFSVSPETIGKLKDRGGKVDAYWWEQEEGQMGEVYVYAGGRYLETAREVERFNEARAEQSAEDVHKLHEQLQRVKDYDNYIAERLPSKARILKEETHHKLTELVPEEVVTLRRGEDGELMDEHETEDWLVTSPEGDDIRARALADL